MLAGTFSPMVRQQHHEIESRTRLPVSHYGGNKERERQRDQSNALFKDIFPGTRFLQFSTISQSSCHLHKQQFFPWSPSCTCESVAGIPYSALAPRAREQLIMQRGFWFMSQSLQGINISSSIVLRPNLKASEARGRFNQES